MKRLVQHKVGRKLVFGITDTEKPGWIFPYTLTKREQKQLKETGWPRKLRKDYPGPKWPEER